LQTEPKAELLQFVLAYRSINDAHINPATEVVVRHDSNWLRLTFDAAAHLVRKRCARPTATWGGCRIWSVVL
jgi:hypothetical protein